MVENGYIKSDVGASAKKKPIDVRFRSFGTQIYAADYFAEEVRRTIITEFGEDRLYGGGLSVRTTLDPNAAALCPTRLDRWLVAFDRQQGWRGVLQKIDVSGDWGKTLADMDIANDVAPWRMAVVTSVERNKVTVGFRPNKAPDGRIPRRAARRRDLL